MQGLERIILDQPFFAGLGPEFGTAISGCARNLRFTAGNICFARANRPTNFICCGKAPWPWSCIRLFNSRWSLRPCAKATSSTGRGWCRPVSGHSMRARQSSCGCSGSTLAACETNARLIATSATSARSLSPDWWGRYPRSELLLLPLPSPRAPSMTTRLSLGSACPLAQNGKPSRPRLTRPPRARRVRRPDHGDATGRLRQAFL